MYTTKRTKNASSGVRGSLKNLEAASEKVSQEKSNWKTKEAMKFADLIYLIFKTCC